jgi:c-di-GMP-binding flagellar brake protein YcgR
VFLPILLSTVLIIGILLLIMAVSQKPENETQKKSSWVQFFAKGKDAGFSFKEIELLRQLAVKSNLEEPSALFWSQVQLDRCIATLVKNSRVSGEDQQQGTQDFIAKLYEYRKKIEFEKPKYRKGITSSRNIEEGQIIRILAKGVGVFSSRLIKNTSQYMTISKPSDNVPISFDWSGITLSVYFWRKDDAGYVFDAIILDEVFSKGLPSLQISHNDALFRTQKRNAIRVKMERPAFMYLPRNGELTEEPEYVPGLKCILSDVSESGCAVVIGGQGKVGLRLKIQFSLDESPICMNGTVKSIDYDKKANKSILHIEADPLPLATKNRIQGEVFGLEENNAFLDPFGGIDDEKDEKIDTNTSKIHSNTISSIGEHHNE